MTRRKTEWEKLEDQADDLADEVRALREAAHSARCPLNVRVPAGAEVGWCDTRCLLDVHDEDVPHQIL